jgi:pseudaminic acid cytidylyltransferase
MIEYAIDAARGSGLFERIIVSTDDVEIAKCAVAAGAEVPFMRPPELADDYTPTVPVVAHAIQACGATGDGVEAVCCIYPAVPMIEPADLKSALVLMEESGLPYSFPVATFPSPIQRALRRGAKGQIEPFHSEYANTRTQDLEPAFYDAGQFYWGRTSAWLRELPVHGNACSIGLPEWRVVDIDEPADWQRAEALYRAIHPDST